MNPLLVLFAKSMTPRVPATMPVDDLEIDFEARTVKRSGQVIELTPREFALLGFLFQNRGTVVTRAMIWRNLYGEEPNYTSNVIDVLIRYLRTKIDRGFDPPLILTRRGEGYLLRSTECG